MSKRKYQPVINPPIPQGINCTDTDEWHLFINAVGEEYTIDFIKKYLISNVHRRKLFDYGIEISDCLNGRYNDQEYTLFIKDMYDEWNTKLGSKYFGH